MRTTVLNTDMTPTGEISVQEAICKVLLDKAFLLETYPDRTFRSQHLEIPAPREIMLFEYVDLPDHFHQAAPLTNQYLFLRDEFTCQYCGRQRTELTTDEFLSRDHVVPLAEGGRDAWSNVVTACISCNHRKADRRPDEADMRLQCEQIRAPKLREVYQLKRERRNERLQAGHDSAA